MTNGNDAQPAIGHAQVVVSQDSQANATATTEPTRANIVDVLRWLADTAVESGVPDSIEVMAESRVVHVFVPPGMYGTWKATIGASSPTVARRDALGSLLMAESAVPGRWRVRLFAHVQPSVAEEAE